MEPQISPIALIFERIHKSFFYHEAREGPRIKKTNQTLITDLHGFYEELLWPVGVAAAEIFHEAKGGLL